MVKYSAVITAILCLVSAAPAPTTKSPTYYALAQLARFDNDQNGIPLVAAAPIGLYLDIFWNGMSLAVGAGSTGVGVTPNSPPNLAAYSATDLATVQQGQPAMVTNYADSTVDHFDLFSFYYGCSSSTQSSAAALPAACVITVKGYADDAATNLVASQSFSYNPNGAVTQTQQMKATLSNKFKGLKRVNYFVDSALLAALIDTVSYTVYSTEPISS